MLLLGPGLLATTGTVHRRQRKMLNPVFSAAYMRGLTPFFYEIVSRVRILLSLLLVRYHAETGVLLARERNRCSSARWCGVT